ncbi:MAG: glycosyltransferase family 2 protein [Planctomycetota bacterium]
MPELSVCFPTYDDFDGLYFSAVDLMTTHGAIFESGRCELLVVDNHPDSPHGKAVADLVSNHLPATVLKRYVAMPEPVGPALAKQKAVDEAAGWAVLVMDSHVRLAPGALTRLLEWYRQERSRTTLCSGPMVYDAGLLGFALDRQLEHYASHMEEQWRGDDLGTWAADPRAADASSEPFAIPAMGCGCFTACKDSFPGFHAEFRGFGAEEFYLYRKARQRGMQTLCLPFLRWSHRFGRPAGVPYPLPLAAKIRNYLIGHLELGERLDGLREAFVSNGRISAEHWQQLVATTEAALCVS